MINPDKPEQTFDQFVDEMVRMYGMDRQDVINNAADTGVAPPGVKSKAPRSQRKCIHLGEQVGEELCPSCRGKVMLKVFACAVHGKAVIGKANKKYAYCGACADKVVDTEETKT